MFGLGPNYLLLVIPLAAMVAWYRTFCSSGPLSRYPWLAVATLIAGALIWSTMTWSSGGIW
jgi:hypothetical protein